MNVIGKIEKLRNEKKWSKYRLAEEAMITYSTLSAMYTRETPPKIDILEAICRALGVTLSEFFMEDNESNVLSEREKLLISNFRQLPEEKKRAILTLFE